MTIERPTLNHPDHGPVTILQVAHDRAGTLVHYQLPDGTTSSRDTSAWPEAAEAFPTPEPRRYYVAATGMGWGVYDSTEPTGPHMAQRVAYFRGADYDTWQDAEGAARDHAAELNGDPPPLPRGAR